MKNRAVIGRHSLDWVLRKVCAMQVPQTRAGGARKKSAAKGVGGVRLGVIRIRKQSAAGAAQQRSAKASMKPTSLSELPAKLLWAESRQPTQTEQL